MTAIGNVADMIVFTPLILIGLSILSWVGYGVWYYNTNGQFPPSFKTSGGIMLTILKMIVTPIRWVFELLWWLIPITPGLRTKLNNYLFPNTPADDPRKYIPMGAWASRNITRTTIILILTAIVTSTILVFTYGYPDTISNYSKYLNYILLSFGVIAIILMFITFNKKILSQGIDNNPWPTSGENLESDRRKWVLNTGGQYLYYTIATGLALAILFALFYFVTKYTMFSVTGTTALMVIMGLVSMFFIYQLLFYDPNVRKVLRKSAFLSNLFYIVFIIPCLFGDTVKYLFNQFRHTPKMAYYFLAGEIILICIYLLIPILQKYLYTAMPGAKDNKIIINRKIKSIKDDIIITNDRIYKVKNFMEGEEGVITNGKTSIFQKARDVFNNDEQEPEHKQLNTIAGQHIDNAPLRNIDDAGWKTIISRNLNAPENVSDLTHFLINYGYTSREMCNDSDYADKDECAASIERAIKYVQTYTTLLIELQSKVKQLEERLEDLEKEKSKITSKKKIKVLLREPVYLKNKKHLSNFEIVRIDDYTIQHNYNYSISAWFFIRAQGGNYDAQYNKFTSILNYGNKPNIKYHSVENKLKIVMDNGKYKKPVTHIIKDVPLQKWNNIVISYDSGILDVFMNSKLIASINSVVPYMNQDQLTVGDTNGIAGGICNVVYFSEVISKERIEMNYKYLKNKNPPVV